MNGRTKTILGVILNAILALAVVVPGANVAGAVPGYSESASEPTYCLVSFGELPVDAARLDIAEAFGMSFLEYRQENTYLVRLPVGMATLLSARPEVSSIRPFAPEDKVSGELKGVSGDVKLRVMVHDGEDPHGVADILAANGATVTRVCTDVVNYVECSGDATLVKVAAVLPAVSSVSLDGEKQTFMNLIQSNTFIGIDTPQLNNFRGSGMLAEVQDNGCDADIIVGSGLGHQDLDTIIYTDGNPVEDDHGTCTSGIMFGTGAGAANAQGIVYQATAAFADWGTGRTTSVQNLWNGNFEQGNAGMNGVVQSNSWSSGTLDGTYTAYSSEDDAAAVAYPKVLTLWAAGNSNSGTGVGLITQDSSNKNGMCIGAIFHDDTAAMADDDYHDAGSGMTPSRGPAADGRMKPDLIAAFDWIYTVDQVGTAGYTTTNYYDDFGGTSGATPTVAGCAVQAYEMYQENYFGNNPTNEIPYSSTIKALLIADAYQYPIGQNLITRNVEGWGVPDMENMYVLGPDYHVISERPQALSSGGVWSRNVYSDGTKPLKITVAWTDPAAPGTTGTGRTLINNLDLKVTSPGGTVYYGNMGLWNNLYSVSGTGTNDWTRTNPTYTDDENNVENVFIQAPMAGIWVVEVSGAVGDVAQGPQHFSMVASGAQPISGVGSIALDKSLYTIPDTAQVTVQDLDLNVNPSAINTVSVNVRSTLEPAGETLLLSETGVDTSTFVNTISLSSTNSAGVLWVAHGNTITATYNDADAGGAGPATVTDTATVDSQVLSATGLTVEWFSDPTPTWINEAFAGGMMPPAGWQIINSGSTGTWTVQATANAGGASPEARFMYGANAVGTSRLIAGPFNTAGFTQLDLQFRQYYDAYGTGVTVRVQTSTDLVSWTNTGWSIVGGTVNVGPGLVTEAITVAENAGSSTFYVAWVIDGNSYQLDYWYVDSVLMTSTGGTTTADNWLNWTLSADDGAGANDVDHYNIYRSSASSGPWDATSLLTTVAAGIGTYTDKNKGEPDGINWWYVVRAVDDAGNIDTNTNAVPEVAASGATATATGPIGGPTNVAGVTLTYAYTGTPTSVNLYYTTNGGTSWTLAGNDASVNGNYAWTCPASGTYGWLASAVGGSSTEPSPPSAGTTPEASSYIFDNVAPSISATTFADGATGVAITAGNYDADFSENMAAVGSVTTNLPGATYSWVDSNTYRIAYTALAYSTTYTTTYQTTFTDVAGNALGGDRVKTFTTGAQPPASATATGPVGGPTTVTAVTLTYTIVESPVSVNLYYTLNGGTTWTLAGNDASVDGSYAWTCPGTGTYGWIASAVGGGSTEPSPPTGGTAPEASSYIVDVTAPAAPAVLTVEWYGLSAGMATYTYAGVTQATNDHYAYICDVDDNSSAELTTPNLQTELTDGQYVQASASDDSRAVSADPGNGDEIFVKSQFHIAQAPATITNIEMTGELSGGAATAFQIFAYNQATAAWVQVGATSPSFGAGVDGTVTRSISAGCANYISGAGNLLWGVYQVDSSDLVNVDFLQVVITYSGGVTTDDNLINWTLSADDGAGADDVVAYNIYRAALETGPWDVAHLLTSVAAGIDTYTDIGAGEFDGTTWWYVVRAEDALGHEEMNINAVPEPTAVPNIPPVSDAGPDQAVIVGTLVTFDGSGSYDTDGTIVSYVWTFFDVGPITLNGVTETHTFSIVGVYVVTLTVTDDDGATDVDTMTVTVNYLVHNVAYTAGWNLISFAVNTEGGKPLATVFADEWSNIAAIQYYDSQTWTWKLYDRSAPAFMNTLKTADESKGYWVNFIGAGDGQLTVLGKALTSTTVSLRAGWNLVGCPDNAGVQAMTVLAGTGYDHIQKFDAPTLYHLVDMLNTELMVPGSAYWVHVPAATSYVVNY